MEDNKVLNSEVLETEVETPTTEFKKDDKEEEKKPEGSKNSQDNSNKGNTSENENKSEGNSKQEQKEDEEDKDKKKKYSLTDIPEYITLLAQYGELQNKFAKLEKEKDALAAEIEPLRVFKLDKEREDKKAMIKSFYMLSDEDKKDVTDNIDTYSLSDIESKLSVICVRNRVSFASAEEQTQQNNAQFTYNLNNAVEQSGASVPEWLKVAKQVEKEMN